MNQKKCKALRRILNLPRIPKEMSSGDRRFYRALKGLYQSKSGPQREDYLDEVASKMAGIRGVVEQRYTSGRRATKGLS